MNNFKNELKSLRPWLIIITYSVILILIALNFSFVIGIISKYLNVLKPFFVGICIAFVLNIPMTKIENIILNKSNKDTFVYKFSRAISMSLTVVFALVIVFFFGYIIIPQLIETIANLINNITNIINGIINNMDAILSFFKIKGINANIDTTSVDKFFSSVGLDWNSVIKSVTDMLSFTGLSVFSYISTFAVGAANIMLSFMLSLYLLAGKEKFIRQTKKLIAALFNREVTDLVMKYSKISHEIFTGFISGQLLEALIIGSLVYIALLIFKMPYSLLISSIISIMALVPIIGPILALIIGFLLVLSVDPVKAVWFGILVLSIQQFDGNFIYPKVVGKSVGLPGIWTLLSIVVFGGMYGITGVILAVPVTAILYATLSEFINKRLDKKGLIVTTDQIKEKVNSDL